MNQTNTLKLFLCYSHLDEEAIKEFSKHLAPLKSNGLINEWYDRKIIAGQVFQDSIDNNLKKADIICLCISANFLNSAECIKEKDRALDLRKSLGITVIPIILSACGWLDIMEISVLLALPTDGKPISDFQNSNTAWYNVYEGIKIVIANLNRIKNLQVNGQFSQFLRNTELLSKAHSQKSEVEVDDIFVFPELSKFDDFLEFEKKISSETLINDFSKYSKILIAGEDQSGKTTLCKKIFMELRKKNFIPIYIADKSNRFLGSMEYKIKKSFKEQYDNVEFEEIEITRVVPIIDDFHYAKHMEKHINHLNSYNLQIVFVDDIFSLNFRDENILSSYRKFVIKQFGPYLRSKLIEKWIGLNECDLITDKSRVYRELDNSTALVNSTLGKVFGSGIMPSYPFFILTILSTHETFEKPLDQEITSQGYCYQALIYLYLRKQGVKNDDVDTYINFLTEIAYYCYRSEKQELPENEFIDFFNSYLNKFNLPIKQDVLLNNLQRTRIIAIDSFNNYSFGYSYLYYFFVGKYLAEHRSENTKVIDRIINNLHVNANAYIAIFISHHSKSLYVLDEIILNAMCLFEKYTPSTLSKDELSFFDAKLDLIVKAVLPPKDTSPEQAREKILKAQDEVEGREDNGLTDESKDKKDDDLNTLAIELRRSVKTVEVMGSIIKNRAGSLEKNILENVFLEAMNVHLKILTSFFELIKDESQQFELVEFLAIRLEEIVKDKTKMPNHEELVKLSKAIFWNMNFTVVYSFLTKIVHSLGSDKLSSIISSVCDKENTPATFLVKHGISLWYNKNLQIDEITKRIDDDGFSETATRIVRFMIANYCSLHPVSYKDIQKIEQRLKIPSRNLLQKNS